MWLRALLSAVVFASICTLTGRAEPPARLHPAESNTSLAGLIDDLRVKARALESNANARLSFRAFVATYRIPAESVSFSDYVVVRLMYEATRDAGFWNLHWTITNQPPNSDSIWLQWRGVKAPSPSTPTASAECDELSALYAFLAGRAGIKGVGLFWPYANHTVAAWVVRPSGSAAVRVVVPTSQIFLDAGDSLGTRKFDPWRQKTIYEYGRRDVPDSHTLPRPLVDFFLSQMEKYAGASDSTFQQLRYLRESVFRKQLSPSDAAGEALRKRAALGAAAADDLAAFQSFAQDMRSERQP